jgi:hypothetical protein
MPLGELKQGLDYSRWVDVPAWIVRVTHEDGLDAAGGLTQSPFVRFNIRRHETIQICGSIAMTRRPHMNSGDVGAQDEARLEAPYSYTSAKTMHAVPTKPPMVRTPERRLDQHALPRLADVIQQILQQRAASSPDHEVGRLHTAMRGKHPVEEVRRGLQQLCVTTHAICIGQMARREMLGEEGLVLVDELVSDGPVLRRHHVDSMLFGIQPRHLPHVLVGEPLDVCASTMR